MEIAVLLGIFRVARGLPIDTLQLSRVINTTRRGPMTEKKTKTEKEKEEGTGQKKKADLDDTYIGPTSPPDDDPRHRGPGRRG